jgi:hypothetical protein
MTLLHKFARWLERQFDLAARLADSEIRLGRVHERNVALGEALEEANQNNALLKWACDGGWSEAVKERELVRSLAAELRKALAGRRMLGKVLDRQTEQLNAAETEANRLRAENAKLRAAIGTPEVYYGVVDRVVAEERERLAAENAKLRRAARLVLEVHEQPDGEFDGGPRTGGEAWSRLESMKRLQAAVETPERGDGKVFGA